MDEEKKTGLADAVETGASAAHTIKGAIKAGKAISGAAKGAAAGGPYGAVAGPFGPDASTSARSLPSLSFCFCSRYCLS